MKIPEELPAPMLAIVEIGILNIRFRCQSGRYELCEAEANHIHNIPELLREFSPDKLAYYLPQYLGHIGDDPRSDLLVHWETLRRWLAGFRHRLDSMG
jgi:hypothetical protein